jgi:hypothetical protein
MQWVFNNPACNGFTRFPTLGLQALRYSWNFDFRVRTASRIQYAGLIVRRSNFLLEHICCAEVLREPGAGLHGPFASQLRHSSAVNMAQQLPS